MQQGDGTYGHIVRPHSVLSSLELHNPVGALLVKYSVAALSATDHVSLLQRVFGPTVTADVGHTWVAVSACVHDAASRATSVEFFGGVVGRFC